MPDSYSEIPSAGKEIPIDDRKTISISCIDPEGTTACKVRLMLFCKSVSDALNIQPEEPPSETDFCSLNELNLLKVSVKVSPINSALLRLKVKVIFATEPGHAGLNDTCGIVRKTSTERSKKTSVGKIFPFLEFIAS